MESCVPLPVEDKQLKELVEKAKDYLLMHGKKPLVCSHSQQ